MKPPVVPVALPPTSMYSVAPGVTAKSVETLAASPIVAGAPPGAPLPPMAMTWIWDTPAGTVKVCSAPV